MPASNHPQAIDAELVAPVAYILSANVQRKDISKGTKAMAVALAYPEPDEATRKGGRGKKKETVSPENSFDNKSMLSQARAVIREFGADSEQVAYVMRGGSLGEVHLQALRSFVNVGRRRPAMARTLPHAAGHRSAFRRRPAARRNGPRATEWADVRAAHVVTARTEDAAPPDRSHVPARRRSTRRARPDA